MTNNTTTYKPGDVVRILTSAFNDRGKEITVEDVEYVPGELIRYDELTGEGGVGHHQWISYRDGAGTRLQISGALLSKPLNRSV